MFIKRLFYTVPLLLIIISGIFVVPANIVKDNGVYADSGVVEDYSLLIITPEEFVDTLVPLVEHKNSTGMPTLVKTLENIYLFQTGTDDPEKIKRAIAEYTEDYGIDYVMLVGDCNQVPGPLASGAPR